MLEVFADLLVQALAYGTELLTGALYHLLVDGEGNIHVHRTCAHITCVKLPPQSSGTIVGLWRKCSSLARMMRGGKTAKLVPRVKA